MTKTHSFTSVAVLAAVSIAITGCKDDATRTATAGTGAPPSALPSPGDRGKPLALTGYSVHRIKLAYPHKLSAGNAETRNVETAWLIKLALDGLGRPSGPVTEFYFGESRIPEYGGYEGGIYIRVYDEAELKALDGKEIFVKEPRREKRSLGKTLVIPDLTTLALEEEREALTVRK
jgi:hypothetical protein